MPISDEKGNGSPLCPRTNSNQSGGNPKIRIAVYGQHEVGKSALTVRYLTKRYIGEYKSNTDLLYQQTVTIGQSSIDVEIVDISTSGSGPSASRRKTFPVEEIQRADGFVIVYSITDRYSFTFAQEALETITNYYNNQNAMTSVCPNSPSNSSANSSPNGSPQPRATCPILLVANKNDLEHLRAVEKTEGWNTSMQFGSQFYELSVAENSPEVYTSFQGLISTFLTHNKEPSKRKFSVSKMLGNLRIGKGNAANQVVSSQASVIDTDILSDSSEKSNESVSSGFSSSRSSPLPIHYERNCDCMASMSSSSVCTLKKLSKSKNDLIFSCVSRSQG